jgi:SnoaL-like polyketide cyclase
VTGALSNNDAVVRRVIDAIWNDGDLDVADELFAVDYVNHHGLIPDLVLGPESIKISVVLYRLAFPKLHITVDELSTHEDTVVLRWTALRSCDRLKGSALTEAQRLATGITRSRVANGRIHESWTEWGLPGTTLNSID